jgi:hypothetical protein
MSLACHHLQGCHIWQSTAYIQRNPPPLQQRQASWSCLIWIITLLIGQVHDLPRQWVLQISWKAQTREWLDLRLRVRMLFVGLLLVGKPGKTAGWLVEIRSTSKREEELLWKVIVRALLKLYDAELNFGSFLLLTGAQKSKFSRKGLSQI